MNDKPLFKNGTESDVTCPDCKTKLKVRTNRENGSQFLGCPNYPECRHTHPIPESWIMRAQGQAELF